MAQGFDVRTLLQGYLRGMGACADQLGGMVSEMELGSE